MRANARLTRRHLMCAAAGLAAVPWALRAGAQAAEWEPADGLRLAGPVQGLVTLDPALSRDLETNFLVRQICRGLVGYDRDLVPVPELAVSVDVDDEQREYTFTLREDAAFHDGRPVEADDVGWSLARALNPETAGGDPSALAGVVYLRDIVGAEDVISGSASSLEGVEVLGAKQVRITLREPSTTFLMKLAAVPAAILDRRQDTTTPEWWYALNGSGPFRIATLDAARLELEPAASRTWDEIAVSSVAIRLGATASQPENLYQAGEIDLVTDVAPQLVPLVQDPASGVEVGALIDVPRFSLAYIALGNWRPPLDDVHIRRALQRAFPADRIAHGTYEGRVLAATGIVPPGMLDQEWPAVLPSYDLEAARAEIVASRYGTPENVPPIRIHAADIGPVEALRDVVERDLGLRVDAVQVNWYDFLAGLAARRWGAYSLLWGADYPDPEAFLWVLFGSDSAENYTGYQHPAVDAALAAARREPDPARRREIYARAQQLLIDDAAVIPLYVPRSYTLARPGIDEVPVTPMGLLGLETIR